MGEPFDVWLRLSAGVSTAQQQSPEQQGQEQEERATVDRLRVEVHHAADARARLIREVRAGLGGRPLSLPCRALHDAQGWALLDELTRQPEYYLARTESALLEAVAVELLAFTNPDELVEFQSGSAHASGPLLDALVRAGTPAPLVVINEDEAALREGASLLLDRHPWLFVHGIVGEWQRAFSGLAPIGRRLVALLGGALGSYTPVEATRFLTGCAHALGDDDHLLLGCDLVKAPALLEAPYHDAAGITAELNRNALHVLDRELGADFDPSRFLHCAIYSAPRSQIELSLIADRPHTVTIPAAGLRLRFSVADAIRTEINRKFTAKSIESLLSVCGLALMRWWEAGGAGLALAARR